MSKIILKKSNAENKIPSTSDLVLGELAVNTFDGEIYIKKNDGSESIVKIGTPTKSEIDSLNINAGTVNSHTVQSDVPSNAVFTDTIYDDSSVLKDSDTVSPVTSGNKILTQTEQVNPGGKVDNVVAGTNVQVDNTDPANPIISSTDTVYDSTNVDNHMADNTIHFTQGSISITESQISDLGPYEPVDSTILRDSDINVNVQGYDSNTVIDSNYVHTDNNYTTSDKNKLNGIESGATGDQTASEILTAIKTVDGAGSGLNADLLDGIDSSNFLRSDIDDVVNGDIVHTGAISYTETTAGQQVTHVLRPQGGVFSVAGNNVGYIKITLPVSWTNTMLQFDVDIFDYSGDTNGKSIKIHLGGYNYSGDSTWHNVFATILTGRTDNFYNVRFGHDGTYCAIYIGESDSSWDYPKMSVSNVVAGHSSATADAWADNWNIEITDTLGTISKTSQLKNVASFAINSDKLDGLDSSQFLRSDIDDVMNGNLAVNYLTVAPQNSTGVEGGEIALAGTADTNLIHIDNYNSGVRFFSDGYTLNFPKSNGTVLHTGNMGSGSGIDADTLDGIDSTQFVRKDITSTLETDVRLISGPNSGWGASLSLGGNGHNTSDTMASVAATDGNIHIDAATNKTMYLNFYSGTGGIVFGDGAGHGVATMSSTGDLTKGSYVYWNSGNDGSGSGLDADTLDGRHATGFINQVFANGYDGMATQDGAASNWIRTTVNGLIPYNSGGASALGTSSWPFSKIYGNDIYDNGTLLENKYLGINDNASSATKLQTARTISLSGDVSGSISFDGSSNKTLSVTVNDDSHSHVIANVDGLQTELNKLHKSDVDSVGTVLWTTTEDIWNNIMPTESPFSKGKSTTGAIQYYSDYIAVSPGETIYHEMWAKQTDDTVRAYMGIERYDKDKKPIADNSGCVYGGLVNTLLSTTWTKYKASFTMPTSHTVYNGSDGSGVCFVKVRILLNYQTTGQAYYTGYKLYRAVDNSKTLNGYNSSQSNTANTVAVRDSSSDIHARLFRSSYGEQTSAPSNSADICFRNDTSDNYMRFMSSGAFKTYCDNIGVSVDGHTHDDRYFTESESNSRFAYKAGSLDQNFNANVLTADSGINMTGGVFNNSTNNSYDKIRVWNSSTYSIGMKSAQTYGGLNDYAMTFTMNNDSDRGFLWRDSDDSASDGAMSLTTAGVLTVKGTVTAPTFSGTLSGNASTATDLSDKKKQLDTSDALSISGHTITLKKGDGSTETVTVPDNNTNTTYTANKGVKLTGTTFSINGSEIPNSADLNTYRTTGIYTQNSNSDASNGSNYPVAQAGILQVLNDDYGNGLFTTQMYSRYNSTSLYHRTYYNGSWSAWRNLAQDTNTNTWRSISDSVSSTSSTVSASSKAVKTAYDLANSKLGASAKAVDSDKLDGYDSINYMNSMNTCNTAQSTNKSIQSGRGSGGVALTINDGQGNANVTFNHISGVPEQDGNAGRIIVNTDSTTSANMNFQVKSNVTSGTSVGLTNTLALYETHATLFGNTVWHAGNDGPGSGLNADLLDGQEGSYYLNTSNIGSTVQGYNANTTTQGNTFNGANELVKLLSDGKLPALDGSNLTGISSSPTDIDGGDSSTVY